MPCKKTTTHYVKVLDVTKYEVIDNLFNCAVDKHKSTKEYEYRYRRREAIDETLTSTLSASQKNLVDECLFELGLAEEHETELLYMQGMKDCVWLLKNLGVLA